MPERNEEGRHDDELYCITCLVSTVRMHKYFSLMIFTTISSDTTVINARNAYFIHIYEATTGCPTCSPVVSAGSGCPASPFSSTGLAFLPLPGGGG